MAYLTGFTILLLLQLIGEVSSRSLGIPIPGPVIGMALLFTILCFVGRIPLALERATSSLLSHFSLLFIPAGVGIMLYLNELTQYWLPIIATIVITTVFTLAVTGLSLQLATRKSKTITDHSDIS